jgi:hypothetical protein
MEKIGHLKSNLKFELNETTKILIFVSVFASVCIVPDISISSVLPKFQLIDFILPFLVPFAYNNRNVVPAIFNKMAIAFVVLILLSIIINNRLACYRDYFEIYKMFKLWVFAVVFCKIGVFNKIKVVLSIVLYILFAMNLMHYFNVFYFNEYIEKFYAEDVQLLTFGYNSIGYPDTKRMLGTLGNPNNNSILFLFFTVFFFPKSDDNKIDKFNLLLSLIALFACQSRTSLIALAAIVIAFLIVERPKIVQVIYLFSSVAISLFIVLNLNFLQDLFFKKYSVQSVKQKSYFVKVRKDRELKERKVSMKNASKGTQYLQTMLSEDINETNSVTSRKKIWLRLWKMIQQKPFFGHAPYKEFFYEHKLYSENEYVLIAWRYGFIGLALYLIYLFLIPMYYFFKWKSKFNNYLYIAIVILITSLTNNPISDPRIMILYFLVLGLLFYEISKKENEEKTVVDR